MTTFRWRAGEISRIEGFSDAVFAFAVTLLVVSLEVPRSFNELMNTMSGFVGFAACFAILLWIWFEHCRFFRRYAMADGLTIVLNGLLLFVVLFYVYPLKFMFTMLSSLFFGLGGTAQEQIRIEDSSTLLVVYSLGFIAVFVVLALLHWRALWCASRLQLSSVERYDSGVTLRAHLLSAAVGTLATGLALVLPARIAGLAGFAYALLGPVHFIHGTRAARLRQRRFAAPEAEPGATTPAGS